MGGEQVDAAPLRVVFMGTPDFAVPALEAIDASRHAVVGVVTKPDRPRGRGRDPRPSAVKRAALERELPVLQPDAIDDPEAIDQLEAWRPDVAVVAAYGQILPPEVLALPDEGCLNIHASLLPKYRGAAPINWAVVEGESETGISIMKMDEGLDTGPVALRERVEIGPLETAGDLHDRLAEIGAERIVDALDDLAADALSLESQDDDRATHAPKLSSDDGRIDWTESGERIANEIRGFNPWPGAFSFHRRDGESHRIKFHLARPSDREGAPGEVLVADASSGELIVGAGEGAVECLELQAPGRRTLEAADFLNGYTLEPGDRFVEERNE
ncbi:MAG: methionyl-tRNA formyltransferase [Bradymonadaceae bacterium]